MWSLIGIALSIAVAVLAWSRSNAAGGFYDASVYGMTQAAHRRYAAVSLAFGLFFALAWYGKRETAGVAALAVYALIVVFYAASFLRGYEDEGDHR